MAASKITVTDSRRSATGPRSVVATIMPLIAAFLRAAAKADCPLPDPIVHMQGGGCGSRASQALEILDQSFKFGTSPKWKLINRAPQEMKQTPMVEIAYPVFCPAAALRTIALGACS
ncbi:hypothetical protein ASG47_07015 [Devosia sp. Leaf420]|nr:hypothetical protein ASG47_07015 [Devosia sp. Leaf420]